MNRKKNTRRSEAQRKRKAIAKATEDEVNPKGITSLNAHAKIYLKNIGNTRSRMNNRKRRETRENIIKTSTNPSECFQSQNTFLSDTCTPLISKLASIVKNKLTRVNALRFQNSDWTTSFFYIKIK